MWLQSRGGAPALLTYCANAHSGESLSDTLASIERFVGPVRARLGVDRMGAGLWLSRTALTELASAGTERLRRHLEDHGLFAFTLNGFPFGDFHAESVKRRVYHPDWSTDTRREHTVELGRALAALLPDDVDEGTVSTLPFGHRAETPSAALKRCRENLCQAAAGLAELRSRTGKSIRVCLEPEPGCHLERTDDAVREFDALRSTAVGLGLDAEVQRHVGLCYDTCHQAVAFEDPTDSLLKLARAQIPIGKIQLSSALRVPDPGAARGELSSFDEPRFLHQVRASLPDGSIGEADDLPEASEVLPLDREWRVHFHVPIHREAVGRIETTRPFLVGVLGAVRSAARVPHLEVETYTWTVLPRALRPRDDRTLVDGLARELAWAREQIE